MGTELARIINILVPIGFLVVFYFLLIRPQQKREKAVREMREALVVGDHVVTIGGIVGRITKVTDTTVTLETGADRLKIVVERWGIGKRVSPQEEQ